MPRVVRNFWIETEVDGRETRTETGPKNKDGGFEITIRMREDGSIITPMKIRGYVNPKGQLVLQAHTNTETLEVVTKR